MKSRLVLIWYHCILFSIIVIAIDKYNSRPDNISSTVNTLHTPIDKQRLRKRQKRLESVRSVVSMNTLKDNPRTAKKLAGCTKCLGLNTFFA